MAPQNTETTEQNNIAYTNKKRQDDNIDWKKKSIEDFKIKVLSVAATTTSEEEEQQEWKVYYEKRSTAEDYHKKLLREDDDGEHLGIPNVIKDSLEELLNKNTKLTNQEKKHVMKQFVMGSLEAISDNTVDDLRSCESVITLYSNYSNQSIQFRFYTYFRIRVSYVEFQRSIKYCFWKKPTISKEQTKEWFLTYMTLKGEEPKIFNLILHDLHKMRDIAFDESIRNKISYYEFLSLIMTALGTQFGETGTGGDDWIGYHNRVLCGCPTDQDYKYKPPKPIPPQPSDSDSDNEQDRIEQILSVLSRVRQNFNNQT